MSYVILVVDDDVGVCDLLEEVLSEEKYTVECRNTGDEAMRELEGGLMQPNIILLDVLMPGLSARSFVHMLRGNPLLRTIPIILVTAAHPSVLKRMGLGHEPLISKPFELPDLLTMIEELLAS